MLTGHFDRFRHWGSSSTECPGNQPSDQFNHDMSCVICCCWTTFRSAQRADTKDTISIFS